jgi:hypothetical protein
METKGYLELSELYSSIYNDVSESHYKVGDKVLSKSGGMKGEVVKVDSEESGDYYTVKSEDGKTAKYAPDELEKNNESPEEQKEETDLFVYILEYLVAEGYADTNENALAIMENMSEEWKESIVESAAAQSDKQIDKGVKTTYKAGNVLDNLHQGRSRGVDRVPYGDRDAKVKRMRGRLKTRRDDLFGERNKREDESRAELKKKYGL